MSGRAAEKRARAGARAGVLGLALLSAACGGNDEGPGAQAQMRGRGGPDAVTPVEVASVERGSIARSVSVSGVVEPIRSVGVNAQVPGALLSVNAEEGSLVRRGQVLARIDDRELSAQLLSAEAQLQVARSAYERAEQLRDRKVITLPEYERDRAAYAAAQASVDQLRTRLGYTTVNAPVSGVVTAKLVEAGDVVSNQTRLFEVADISTMVVRVGVSELDVVELRVGDAVQIMLDAYPGRTLSGRIRRVFPSANPDTRLVPVEVAFDEASARVARPGFLARVTFRLSAQEDVLLVPASALMGGQGSQAVFVVENDRAIRRTVETGLTSSGRVEILSGLDGSEVIVTAGSNMLRDGAAVRVNNTLPAPASSAQAPQSDT
ncbi:MAG TPA: efflux RND transporter periplasmic adaptor subunit [Longimicrobiales bacterium]|nr:efflux RND transporter periplasmic adaptor subunit [Longimicrobiales bacterium]